MRPILRASSLALLLVACPGPSTTTPTGDTGTTDTGTGPFAEYAPADLTDPEAVRALANNVSAPNAFLVTTVLYALVADVKGDCPALTVDGDTSTYTGGCTDADGDVWEGTATVTGDPKAGTVTYDAFGLSSEVDCDGGGTIAQRTVFDGTVALDASQHFSIAMDGEGDDVDHAACTSATRRFRIEYDGQLVEAGASQETWSGSGRYGDSVRGKVQASTVDEILDDKVCSSEALSGTTTMGTADHTAVITYDGATDCDPTSTVTWTLDGADRGELEGVACATGPGGSGLAMLLSAGLLGLWGLRRRTPPARRG